MTARGEKPSVTDSFEAEADLSALQYTFVKAGAAEGIAAASAQGERTRGILTNDPTLGQYGNVMMEGIAVGILGTAVANGGLVTCSAAGLVEPALTGDWARGEALETQATVGALVAFRLLDHLVP